MTVGDLRGLLAGLHDDLVVALKCVSCLLSLGPAPSPPVVPIDTYIGPRPPPPEPGEEPYVIQPRQPTCTPPPLTLIGA